MHPLQQLLPHVVGELMRQGPLSPAKLEVAWRLAVGPGIGRVTSVVGLDSGILGVRATTPQWQQEIGRSSGLIVERLAALLGPGIVNEIAVVHGRASRARSAPSRTRGRGGPTLFDEGK